MHSIRLKELENVNGIVLRLYQGKGVMVHLPAICPRCKSDDLDRGVETGAFCMDCGLTIREQPCSTSPETF